MQKTLREQLLKKKTDKARQGALAELSRSGGVLSIFRNFKHKPSESQYIDMVTAGMIGPGDPLSAGGSDCSLEYLLDEINLAFSKHREEIKEKAIFDPNGDINCYLSGRLTHPRQ